jgi:4-O-beta-D-mannosyl-D-glucose phosphorylase
MNEELFRKRKEAIRKEHEALLTLKNEKLFSTNGIYNRYRNPVLTRDHFPMEWRYDFNPLSNPLFMERISFNAAFNAGAIKWKGKYLLAVRGEGNDRKSFFAIAESPNGVDNFRFWERPLTMPETKDPDTNVYSAPSEKTPMHPTGIQVPQWQLQGSPAQKTWWNGSDCRT